MLLDSELDNLNEDVSIVPIVLTLPDPEMANAFKLGVVTYSFKDLSFRKQLSFL